jgi:hypothetical protein
MFQTLKARYTCSTWQAKLCLFANDHVFNPVCCHAQDLVQSHLIDIYCSAWSLRCIVSSQTSTSLCHGFTIPALSLSQITMVSQDSTMHNIDSLPPSDFKDLLLLLQDHEASFNDFLKSIKRDTTTFARQDLDIVRNLKQQNNNIDAHYGWALASDSALAARMFESDDEEEAQTWMRRMFREYEERKQQLNKLVKGL